jgi:hypothetical protein
VDLWPYVNGKALTLGLSLAEMELSNMLDVLHFFFEEDSRFVSAEEAEAVSALRSSLYKDLYGVKYRYGASKTKNNQMSANDYPDFLDETKPYIPPTEFDPDRADPFGGLLDAPIG